MKAEEQIELLAQALDVIDFPPAGRGAA